MPKPNIGARLAALKEKLAGRKKLGKNRFQKRASKGNKRASPMEQAIEERVGK